MDTLQVADRIKHICKSKKVTIKIMLESCNINRNFMYDLKNERIPSSDKLELIADYLDCSVDYLLCRTDNPDSHKL